MAEDLPVTFLLWGLALLPIILLLVLLVGLRWKAPQAGPLGMFLAAAIAVLAFRAPFHTLAVAGAKGVWDAIFILYVIWPALLLYLVADRAGAFEALREGIQRFSRNGVFLVLAFGWVFASFLQGIAGFGVPIAVVAPLLVGLGVRPIYAVAIPLVGHAWANMFGTLAVGWLATLQVVDLADPMGTALQTSLLLWIPNLLGGLSVAWLYGRGAALRHALPFVLIVSLVHGGLQVGLSLFNPVLSTFVAATTGLVLLFPLARWRRYSEPAEGVEDPPAMAKAPQDAAEEEREEARAPMSLWMSLLPYGVLTAITIVGLVPPAVENLLGRFELGIPFPATQTGYGTGSEAQQPYSPFSPFNHPGTFLLLASLVTWLVYRSRGYFRRWREEEDVKPLGRALLSNGVPASVAVLSFLVMSKLMDESGQTTELALGIAAVAPPLVFAFASNFIGVLGAFMTSSNTASNILFAPLQQDTAAALGGISESTVVAAQSTGGAIGNAIAPANVVLGTGTAGIVGQEGDVLRRTLPWATAVAVITGAATILLTLVFPGGG